MSFPPSVDIAAAAEAFSAELLSADKDCKYDQVIEINLDTVRESTITSISDQSFVNGERRGQVKFFP